MTKASNYQTSIKAPGPTAENKYTNTLSNLYAHDASQETPKGKKRHPKQLPICIPQTCDESLQLTNTYEGTKPDNRKQIHTSTLSNLYVRDAPRNLPRRLKLAPIGLKSTLSLSNRLDQTWA